MHFGFFSWVFEFFDKEIIKHVNKREKIAPPFIEGNRSSGGRSFLHTEGRKKAQGGRSGSANKWSRSEGKRRETKRKEWEKRMTIWKKKITYGETFFIWNIIFASDKLFIIQYVVQWLVIISKVWRGLCFLYQSILMIYFVFPLLI